MRAPNDRFKSKAKDILRSPPQSIQEFLDESQENPKNKMDVQIHKCADAEMHKASEKKGRTKDYVRIHVHIRENLADKLLEAVFLRKKNHRTKKEASQRAIIEEALELYFQKINV